MHCPFGAWVARVFTYRLSLAPHRKRSDLRLFLFPGNSEIKLPEQERAGRGLIDEEKVIIAY